MHRFTLASLALSTLAIPALAGIVTPQSAVALDATGTARPVATTKLSGVSASSPTDAWTVGFRSRPGEHTLALTRHWDGKQWKTIPSAHPSENSFLWGVADLSPTDAWAVGEWIGQATIQPFTEHWDGTAWTEVPLDNPPGLGRLNAVSASGPDDVWMVGTGNPGPFGYPRTFIEHWDGSHLHRVKPARLTRARSTDLTGVSAVAPDDVWAVGAHGWKSQTYFPLIEHFDGTRWTAVTSRLDAGTTVALVGVDAISANDVWTVGWQAPDGQPTISSLAEHWDGTSWTHSPTLAPGYSSNLTSVSAVAADDVWAVGTWVKSEQDRRTLPLIEHWDGQAWSILAAPAHRQASTSVESVSMATATDGFAVGETTFAAQTTAYATRWDGETWGR